MGHEHVVEAMGHEHVVEAMGHEHVVEAMGHEHVVEAMGHEHVVEAMGHEHAVDFAGMYMYVCIDYRILTISAVDDESDILHMFGFIYNDRSHPNSYFSC